MLPGKETGKEARGELGHLEAGEVGQSTRDWRRPSKRHKGSSTGLLHCRFALCSSETAAGGKELGKTRAAGPELSSLAQEHEKSQELGGDWAESTKRGVKGESASQISNTTCNLRPC